MSPRNFSATALSSLLLIASATASEAPATPTPAPYLLKQRSSFHLPPDGQRAPFWPIGWVKRRGDTPQAQLAAAPAVVLDEKSFKVTSILIGNPSLVIINGRTYMEGEFIRQARPASAPTVATSAASASSRTRVFRINDGQVVLQHQNQTITVGLQRPELAQRKGDEELLSDDRP